MPTGKSKLAHVKANAWDRGADPIHAFAEGYKIFLSNKTERECAYAAQKMLEDAGFVSLASAMASGRRLACGDKVYLVHQGKAVVALVLGQEPLEAGMAAAAAHIDSPRLDLKGSPLYEKGGLALLKTHYYGGIKKYQWTALPLALHGVIYTQDARKIEISIGENEGDPVFFISDLLPHMAQDQMAKRASDFISAEQLNIVVGSLPAQGEDESKKVKDNVLALLFEKYGIDEKSFLSAEIEAVPAGGARDVGFDRGLIAAYGHDDRVCAYPALKALAELKSPKRTAVCILADKEEIGSEGSSGLNSRFFENFVAEVLNLSQESYSELSLRRAMANSRILSMDVTSAYDPSFSDVFDEPNTAIVGAGASIVKYTGSRGKVGASDASAEFVDEVIRIFDGANVAWQSSEMGKVDMGGGGTVAKFLASYGAHVLDFGVPVLSMHAPWEAISKADLYSAYEGIRAFYESV